MCISLISEPLLNTSNNWDIFSSSSVEIPGTVGGIFENKGDNAGWDISSIKLSGSGRITGVVYIFEDKGNIAGCDSID